MLITHSNAFVHRDIECVTLQKHSPAVGGEGGVACEGKFIGVPKLHPWGKCTMPSSQIGRPTLSLACALTYLLLLLVDAHKKLGLQFHIGSSTLQLKTT